MDLKNKVALVTGAASGIGYNYCSYLLFNGVKVAFCDIDKTKCQSIVDEFSKKYGQNNVLAVYCDVTDNLSFENAFKSCIDYFKKLDIVINNAGIFNETMKDWNKTMEINYGGVVRGTMLALKYMGTPFGGKGGTVVQTASIAGLMSNIWIAPMYRSTKRAVVEYTRAVGDPRTFQHFNVRIMAICPGFTDTPLLEGDRVHQHLIKEFYEVAQKFANNFPLQSVIVF
ncbi:15-hydroxyprostaglandin dehydrogenase [NAD(+)]-like isoform X2 [Daktulosphaira vitifoliae]|uniref:15-hydroxyprostaglandin dehydrogenase [NAD(+)]-like isoform X2 n=1 Tax=Daktulosphaira vitifoliae TaxID=58002 RepID=UPI0021AB00D4|nr:15-hydroxyprostaglandin dehydrogenase [NAD(+)]-like isoform X2 [Daktulosphaira vitifoliae]